MKFARRERRQIAILKRQIMPATVKGPNPQVWTPDRTFAHKVRKEKAQNAARRRNAQRRARHGYAA